MNWTTEPEKSERSRDPLLVTAVILARVDSRRLRGKALQPISDMPLLEVVIRRAQRARLIDTVIVATTARDIDDPVASLAEAHGVATVRGSTDDVVKRCLAAYEAFGGNYLLRLNGDSPFLDPVLLDEGIGLCTLESPDMLTNIVPRSFPYGISVEMIRWQQLIDAYPSMDADEKEHVTLHFYRNLAQYQVTGLHSRFPDLKAARLVIDTAEDLTRMRRIAARLGPEWVTAPFQEAAVAYLSLFGPDRIPARHDTKGLTS